MDNVSRLHQGLLKINKKKDKSLKRKTDKGYGPFHRRGNKNKNMWNLTDDWKNAGQKEIPFLTHYIGKKFDNIKILSYRSFYTLLVKV